MRPLGHSLAGKADHRAILDHLVALGDVGQRELVRLRHVVEQRQSEGIDHRALGERFESNGDTVVGMDLENARHGGFSLSQVDQRASIRSPRRSKVIGSAVRAWKSARTAAVKAGVSIDRPQKAVSPR